MRFTTKFVSSILVATLFLSFSAEASFRYVDQDEIPRWAEEAIDRVREKRIMTGFSDGRFAPDDPINRAQAVTLLLRLKDMESQAQEADTGLPFGDVPRDAWFRKGVALAYKKGWINGKSINKFKPGDALNRAEWATMIVRAFDLETDNASGGEYQDVPSRAWFAPFVSAVAENDLIRFPQSRSFGPQELVTRADAAWLMAKILGMPRLMGTSLEGNYTSQDGVMRNRRRVAVKPRDFDPNDQGLDVEKNELFLEITPEDEVLLVSNADYQKVGSFTVENRFPDDSATFEDIQMRIRFENTGVGPEDEFEVKMEGQGQVWETQTNTRGGAVFTGLGVTLDPQEVINFEVFVRPKADVVFFQKTGKGSFYLFKAGGIVSRVFKSSGRVGKRYAPVGIENRQFASIYFDPTK